MPWKSDLHLTDEGLDEIMQSEGFRAAPYRDGGGVWTQGFGHTNGAGAPLIEPGNPPWTREYASTVLRNDLTAVEQHLKPALKAPTSPSQYSAFVSLGLNIGWPGLLRSTALRRHNACNYAGAAEAITWWNKDNGRVVQGLVNRRERERTLYLSDVPDELAPTTVSVPVNKPTGGEHKPIVASKTVGLSLIGSILAAATIAAQQFRDFAAVLPDWPFLQQVLPAVLGAILLAVLIIRVREWMAGEH